MFEIKNDLAAKTIRLRITGRMDVAEARDAADQSCRATDAYNGAEHMILADMRGLVTLSPEAAAVMGESIAYQRRRGVVLCAHLSDSSITRLQAQRVAREASPTDSVTIDVVSLAEAEEVLSERRPMLARLR